MKLFIPIIVGLLAFVGVFILDSHLINYIISIIPKSASEYYDLIKLGLWILAVIFTSGIAIGVGILIGGLVGFIMNK